MEFFWKMENMACQFVFTVESCIPYMDLPNEVSCASSKDCMPKLRPQEVDVLIYPKEAPSFGD